MFGIRRMLAALTASGTALLLAACGGAGVNAADQSVEVYSFWTSGSESAALNALFSAYKTHNPGDKIVNSVVTGGGGANAQATLDIRLESGDPPDSWVTHAGVTLAQLVDSNEVADLSDIYRHDGLSSAVPKALLDAMSKDGKVYAVATGAHRGNVLWFNRALLNRAGVTTPTDSYTMPAFLADLHKLKAAGIVPLCLGGKDIFAPTQLFENSLLGVLGPQGWNDLVSGKTSWDSAAVRTAASDFSTLLNYADPEAANLTWDQATKKLASGSCAFETMGDWAYGEMVKDGATESETFGYAPYPGTSSAFVIVVDVIVVAKNAPHKDVAMKWASTVVSKDAQLNFNKIKGSTPVRTDLDLSSLPPYQQQAAQAFRGKTLVQSVDFGEAVNPQFQQALDNAATNFIHNRNTDQFVQALVAAAK